MDPSLLKYIPEPPREELLPAPKRGFQFKMPGHPRRVWIGVGALVFIIVGLLYYRFLSPTSGIQAQAVTDAIVTVPKGEGLSAASERLGSAGAIRSEFAFKALIVLFGGSRGIQAGEYYFPKPENAVWVAWRLTHSLSEFTNVRVTIPEGLNSAEIGTLIDAVPELTRFKRADFLKIAAPHEGYLFPDTYFFLPNVTADDVVKAMLVNYHDRIETLSAEIQAFGKPLPDVIKMASIVEEEARTDETRRTIAGILWKRLKEGMPLQVDSAFAFVNGEKDSRDLSTADLAIESPYNTYIHKGLPPTAIANPGLDAIRATVTPIPTGYYFYLSDKDGNMHYAVTLDEHVINKAKYLDY
ncbi:MAG TPA: endolytic transglycosylase MltG [Candidatus Paceibacterota bacterium]|nr:endolytic transglycosylase MltG [Candidatus Paceibacterota bacterium]